MDTRGLAENSPFCILANAWTQGLLSVRIVVLCSDCTINGWKYLTADPMLNASLSHGSQSIWLLFSFALKKPAILKSLGDLSMYNVDAIAGLLVVASRTIHSLSVFWGRVMDEGFDKYC